MTDLENTDTPHQRATKAAELCLLNLTPRQAEKLAEVFAAYRGLDRPPTLEEAVNEAFGGLTPLDAG